MVVAGTAVFTVIEAVTLVVWLALARAARRIAAVVLFGGLVVEHIVQFNVAHGRKLWQVRGVPLLGTLGFSAIETVIWVVWLFLTGAAVAKFGVLVGNVVGGVFLAGTLVAKHAIAENVQVGRPAFDFKYGADGDVVTASIIEGVGGQLWLANVEAGRVVQGIMNLVIFSFAEHLILINRARRILGRL